MEESAIAEFYRGRSVFITGATGFLGKVLVEKLLRSCPHIKNLYLLIRPKSGQDINIRLQQFTKNLIFEEIRSKNSQALNKLVAIEGDVTLPQLGLSPSNLQLLCDHVSVVFNSAASVRFDEDLITAVEMNVRGPQRVVNLCHQMPHLEVLVHVSTTYNNLEKVSLEEVIYKTSISTEKLFHIADTVTKENMESVTKTLIGSCPNTYSFTKAYAENLIQEEHGQIPVAIIRPSIVTAAMKEPKPGWIDNKNGPTGLIAGGACGVLRVTRVDESLIGDIIPVDVVIHLMIAAGWHTATTKPVDVAMYNIATSHRNPITWKQFRLYTAEAVLANPAKDMLWYPSFQCHSNYFIHEFMALIFHFIPAHIVDIIARLIGQPPRLVKFYDRAHRAMNTLCFYLLHTWRFVNNNSIRLSEQMSAVDRDTFYFDVRDINWHKYLTDYVLGTRQYILKDALTTLPIARRKLNRLFWVNKLIQVALLCFIVYHVFILADYLHL